MSVLPTQIEAPIETKTRPAPILGDVAERETQLSRLLMVYIATGLSFMLLPGTFLGVWNLFAISAHRASGAVSQAWIQAHGHAQIFGWIGTFILGIGYHSIPRLRRLNRFSLAAPWTSWALWTSGVTLRWFTGVYQWQWRIMMPVSAALELLAFLIFFRIVSGHRPQELGKPSGKTRLEEWIFVVIAGTVGLLLTLLVNFGAALFLALRGVSPVLTPDFDGRILVLQTWGFLVLFVWGFSAKWLPVFLGLRPLHGPALLVAVAVNSAGVIAALTGRTNLAVYLLLAGTIAAIVALRLFEWPQGAAKTKGVHTSFPVFVRLAYLWLVVAAVLEIWAARQEDGYGIWGASRHALTVGFLATMVFMVGQRVLPAFCGMRLLFSTKLMFLSALLLTVGCLLRVRLGDPGVPGNPARGVVLAAGFRGVRDDGRNAVCSESAGDVCAAPACGGVQCERRSAMRSFDDAPFLAIWELTQACDLACVHCRASAIAARTPCELTTEEGFRLLEEVRSFGDPLMVFTGGDPLKREDVFTLLEKSTSLGLRTTITPSATPLLTEGAIDRFRRCGVARMAISLDGPDAASHDGFRRVEGSFSRTMTALEYARKAGLPTQINTTVTQHNIARLDEIAEIVGGFGASLWSVFFLVATGRASALQDLSAAEYEEVFGFLYKLSKTAPFDIKTTEAQHYRRYVAQRRKEEGAAGTAARAAIGAPRV